MYKMDYDVDIAEFIQLEKCTDDKFVTGKVIRHTNCIQKYCPNKTVEEARKYYLMHFFKPCKKR
ncbi:MAG: hypothetical protein C0403_13145 [Desulfobacterium sp.]|nr:hypothetical protein [Desulfobacterium sp.]